MFDRLRRASRRLPHYKFIRDHSKDFVINPILNNFLKAKHYNNPIEDKILISSTSRSGTTWFADLLNLIPNSAVIWEPFGSIPSLRDRRQVPYLKPGEVSDPLRREVKSLFDGEFLEFHMTNHLTFRQLICSTRYIYKACRSNRILPWINQYYDLDKVVILVRHPCAVVSSQLSHGAWDDVLREGGSQFPNIVSNLKEKLPLNKMDYESITEPEEKLALNWALDYFVLGIHKIPNKWNVTTYERLMWNQSKETMRILDELGYDSVSKSEIETVMNESSRTTVERADSVRKQLSKWKRRLTDNQVENILRIVRKVGIKFYNADLRPDHAVLEEFLFNHSKE